MEGRRLISLMFLAFALGSGSGRVEPTMMDLESSRCFSPKFEEIKMLTPGIHTTRPPHRRSERNTFHQMKFEVWYDESVTSSSGRDIIMNITRETVDLISRQLEVREETADIIQSRDCDTGSYVYNGTVYNCTCAESLTCGTAQIPEQHLQPCLDCKLYENGTEYDCEPEPGGPTSRGVKDVHYVLYVASVDVCPPGVIGFAGPCYIDSTYNRPIVGYINLCPDALNDFEPEFLQVVAQHEIYHAIGMSPSLFAFYRDQNGDPLTPLGDDGFPLERDPDIGWFQWSDRVVRTQTLEWDVRGGPIERNVSIMVTPNLIREARDFFGCDTIEGVELEDDYGRIPSGRSLSHFELRLMPSESMAPFISPRRSFSRFTLAFFEDTGWYRANYDLADPYEYGRDLGCGFVQKSCKWWMDTQRQRGESLRPYCENSFELVCNVEGTDAALCTNDIFDEPLPPQYQYFDSQPGFNDTEIAKVGGAYMIPDHCPVIIPFPSIQTNDYRRQTCKRDIDECVSNPCRNGATCSDVITGYFCTCTAGYEGRQCTHSKSVCVTTEQCTKNEVCTNGLCRCGYGRIRIDEECSIPRRFDMTFLLTEVNGSLAAYPDTINTGEAEIRRDLEYAIFLRLSRWEIFVDSVYSVDIRSFFSGSLGVEVDIVLDLGSTANDVSIYDLMTDDYYFDATALSSSNTAFTLNVTSLVVQDLDECNMTDYSACSVFSTCNNTLGAYQCACLPGFVDQGDAIDGPGTVCIDIDECSNSSLFDCSKFARCDNTPGGYDCTCLSGYVDNGPFNGRSGISCTDIDECISSPCFNGGACWNFKDTFTCECPSGFEGRFCETIIESCASEDLCSKLDHELCRTSGLCNCRPGYLRRNGICQAIAIYTGSVNFTSVNGAPLVYTAGLSDSSRPAFNQLAQRLRGTLLSVIPEILDASFTSFRSGSVIGDFDLFVADGTSRDAVTTAVLNGLGDGTLLAGEDIVGVDPTSMRIEDVNECIFAELNDCSPLAECTNVAGTFSCACPSGYIDTSPTGAGLGKDCLREEVPDEKTDSTSIIIILAIVLCVIFILFATMIAILICCRLTARKFKEKEEQRQIHDDNLMYANPSTRPRSQLQHGSTLPVYGHDYHLDNAYTLNYREARGHRTRMDRPVHHHDHDRRGQVRTVSNIVYGLDQRFDPRFDQGFGAVNGQLCLEYPNHHRSSSPTRDIERKQHLMSQRQSRISNGALTNPRTVPY